MTLNQLFQITISLTILFSAGRSAQFKKTDLILFLISTPILAFIVSAYTGLVGIPGWTGAPIAILFGGGLAFVIFDDKKKFLPRAHEGGLLLTCLTLIYVLTTLPDPLRWIIAGIFSPFFILLLFELISPKALKTKSRFFLGFLNCLGIAFICLFQVSYFQDFASVAKSSLSPSILVASFVTQLTIFRAFYHLHLIYVVFENSGKKKYWSQFWDRPARILTDTVAEHSLSRHQIMIASLIHSTPLILNALFNIVPPNFMVFFAVIISPQLIGALFRKMSQD